MTDHLCMAGLPCAYVLYNACTHTRTSRAVAFLYARLSTFAGGFTAELFLAQRSKSSSASFK